MGKELERRTYWAIRRNGGYVPAEAYSNGRTDSLTDMARCAAMYVPSRWQGEALPTEQEGDQVVEIELIVRERQP